MAIGRFLSGDPVGFAQGGPGYFNRYAYVGNDPVNATDPTGMQLRGAAGAAGRGAATGGTLPIVVNNDQADQMGTGILNGVEIAQKTVTCGICTVAELGARVVFDLGLLDIGNVQHSEQNDPSDGESTSDGPAAGPDVGDFENPDSVPDGWEWRGRGRPGDREGAWHNPETGESLHDDRTHPAGKEPHWTYTDGEGHRWDAPDDDRQNWEPQQ